METDFPCASCGARAMRLVVTSAGDPPGRVGRAQVHPARDGVRAACGTFDVWTAESELGVGVDWLRRVVGEGDAASLAWLDRELVPLYCPDCSLVYCVDHWATWEVLDTDFPGRWVDEVRGRCPEGHERLIHD